MEPDWSGTTYVEPDLIYWHLMGLWIEVDGVVWVVFREAMEAPDLVLWDGHPSSDDSNSGDSAFRTSAIDAPAPLVALAGATVTAVTTLWFDGRADGASWDEYVACGYIFETTKGTVAVGDVGAGWYAVGGWPNKERWDRVRHRCGSSTHAGRAGYVVGQGRRRLLRSRPVSARQGGSPNWSRARGRATGR